MKAEWEKHPETLLVGVHIVTDFPQDLEEYFLKTHNWNYLLLEFLKEIAIKVKADLYSLYSPL